MDVNLNESKEIECKSHKRQEVENKLKMMGLCYLKVNRYIIKARENQHLVPWTRMVQYMGMLALYLWSGDERT